MLFRSHDGVVLAETKSGEPCLFFASHRGVYRLANDGLKYCFRDNEDYWFGKNGKPKINLNAGTPVIGIYYSELGQVWYWFATGNGQTPTVLFVLDIKNLDREDSFGLRGGWSVYDGGVCAIAWACMWSEDHLGGIASKRLKPLISKTGSGLERANAVNATNDNGVTYQSYIKTRSIVPIENVGNEFTVSEPWIVAKATAGVSLQLTLDRDFGLDATATDTVSIAASGTETRVTKRFTGGVSSDIGAIQIQVGDAAAGSISQWALDAIIVPVVDSGDLGRS